MTKKKIDSRGCLAAEP